MPVGLWFEDKVALRSRVLVRAGEPLDLDHELWAILPEGAEATDEDHESVRALTAAITERLRAVSPDFDTFLDSAAFSWAADIALREGMERPQQSVPLAQREPLAARLARSDADERARLSGELGRYSLALDALGVTDEELVPQADADEPVQARGRGWRSACSCWPRSRSPGSSSTRCLRCWSSSPASP